MPVPIPALRFSSLRCLLAMAYLLVPSSVLAHSGDLIQGRVTPNLTEVGNWFVWEVHPSIGIGTVVLALAYRWATTRWRLQRDRAEPVASREQQRLYYGGLVVMYLSLDGPLHHLADELLFSAHMLQHMVLQLVWAPMLVLGVPPWLWRALAALPGAGPFSRQVTRPWTGLLIFQAALWGWHLPWMYNLALQVHAWHIVEHLCFMVSAVIFWFIVLAPLPELCRSLPKRMAFIFLNMTAMKTLGLMLTMSSGLIYVFYATAPRALGLDVMSDQQVGGMIMWMPGGGLMWFGVARLFWLWVNRGTPARGLTGIAAIDDARRGQLSADARLQATTTSPDLVPDDQPGAYPVVKV